LSDFAELLKIAKQLQQRPQRWTDVLPQAVFSRSQAGMQRKDSPDNSSPQAGNQAENQTRNKVAYFLVDALCHEMAKEFFSDLQETSPQAYPKTNPPKVRSAELPPLAPKRTTEVSRTASWPFLATEKDYQRFKKELRDERYKASKSDNSTVHSSEKQGTDEASASRHRVEFLKLKEVCEQTAESLVQSCSGADLIVVDGKEIGTREFDESHAVSETEETKVSLVAFGHWIEQVQLAWERLRNLGVQEFVFITGNSSQDDVSTPAMPEKVIEKTPEIEMVRETANLQEPSALKVRYQIEAEAKPDMLGYSRMQIRVKPTAEELRVPVHPAPMIHLALRIPERPDIQVTIKDAPGAVMNNLNKHQLAIPLNHDWIEVLFDLTGLEDERVRVAVYETETEEELVSVSPEVSFSVVGTLAEPPDPPDTGPESMPATISAVSPTLSSTWQDSFEDENIRAVFIHLQRHGSVTEHELTQFLGGARKARSFSLAFEEYLKKVPFSVRIETTASGKRYVKET
jgi:hypothetical protein